MRKRTSRVWKNVPALVLVSCILIGLASNTRADEGEDLYFGANALYNRKLYELAIKEYEGFLENAPEHAKAPNARMGLGLSHYATGDYAAALPMLEQTITDKVVPDLGQIRLLVGQCHLLGKAPDKAATYFQALAEDTTASAAVKADAYAGWVESLYLQKKWAEVITASDALWASDPTGERALRARFQGAASRHNLKKYKAAGEVLATIVEEIKDPGLQHQAVFLLAECEREEGQTEKAEAHYLRASGTKGGAFQDQALFRLGFTQFVRASFPEAAKTFSAFLDQHSKHALAPQSQLYLGRCYLEQKDYDAAEKALRAALGSAPGDSDAALWLARAYSRPGNFKKAADVLKPLVDDPKAPREILFDYANATMAAERFEPAADVFARVVALDAKWEQASDALRLQAVCLHRAGKHKESLAVCSTFVAAYASDANIADVTFLLGENQFLTSAADKAQVTLTGFVTKYAEHENRAAAMMRLAQILYGQKKWSEALAQAQSLPDASRKDAFFAQADFIQADCHYHLEQWGKAASLFSAFAAAQPKAANADTALAKAALSELQGGDASRAAAAFGQLVKNHSDSPHLSLAFVELGRMAYESKAYDEARKHLNKVSTADDAGDDLTRAAYYLGWIDLAEGKDADAEKQFDIVAKAKGASASVADAKLQLGLLHIKKEAFESAIEHLNGYLHEHPGHSKEHFGRFYLGVALARAKQFKEATPLFKAIAEKNGELAHRARYEWAWCAKGLKDNATAMKQYNALLKSHADSPLADRAAFELSELESDAGKSKPAIKRLEGLLATVKDDALRSQVQYRLGWCYAVGDAPEKGIALLETLIEDDPDSELVGLAHYHAGQTALKRKEYTRSREHFENAVAFTPALDSEFLEMAWLRLGEVKGLTSKWAEAEVAFNKFLETYPKSQWSRRAHLGLGWALENKKQYIDALVAYAMVLKTKTIDETAARAQFQIGECHFAMKDYDMALKALLAVEVKYPFPEWVSKAMLEMGRTLEQKGDNVLAIDQYELLLQKYPDSDVASLATKRIAELSK